MINVRGLHEELRTLFLALGYGGTTCNPCGGESNNLSRNTHEYETFPHASCNGLGAKSGVHRRGKEVDVSSDRGAL